MDDLTAQLREDATGATKLLIEAKTLERDAMIQRDKAIRGLQQSGMSDPAISRLLCGVYDELGEPTPKGLSVSNIRAIRKSYPLEDRG